MTGLMQARKRAVTALWVTLVCGIIAWALTITASLSDLFVEVGYTSEEILDSSGTPAVRPSLYLALTAIVVLTLGGLFGRRIAFQAGAAAPTRLARPVARFGGTILVVGMVLAAIQIVVVFLNNFYARDTTDPAGARVLNSYLPIVLFTALIIVGILAGFVFSRPTSWSPPQPSINPVADVATAQVSTPPDAATRAGVASAQEPGTPRTQRLLAFAFAVPIIAVMLALVLGLILVDLTGSALEAWMWVLVQAIIAIGIVLGTLYSARAAREMRTPELRFKELPDPAGADPATIAGPQAGARILNFVLSLIFAVAVTCMSLGYGIGAVDQLRIQSSMSLDLYADGGPGRATGVDPEIVHISASGYDYVRKSSGVLTLEPAGKVLIEEAVDSSGSFWIDEKLPTDLAAGAYTLTLTATEFDGEKTSVMLEFAVTKEGLVSLPSNPNATSETAQTRVMAVSPAWVFGDMLPAFVLLLLVVGMLHLTIRFRFAEAQPQQ